MIRTFVVLLGVIALSFIAGVEFSCVRRREYRDRRREEARA